MRPRTFSLVTIKMPPSHHETGFSLLEALIGLAFSAALMALVIDALGTDAKQNRMFVSRSDQAVQHIRGKRTFTTLAAQAKGQATSQQVGALRISGQRLVSSHRSTPEVLMEWADGKGQLSYSTDGQRWRSSTVDAGPDLVRFSVEGNKSAIVWIAP